MEIVVRAAVMFVFLIVLTRAVGKKELTQLTAFELILMVTIGDLVVIAAGTPGERGVTNRVIVHEVGHLERAPEMHHSQLAAD